MIVTLTGTLALLQTSRVSNGSVNDALASCRDSSPFQLNPEFFTHFSFPRALSLPRGHDRIHNLCRTLLCQYQMATDKSFPSRSGVQTGSTSALCNLKALQAAAAASSRSSAPKARGRLARCVSTCGRTRHRRTTLSAAPSLFLLLLVGSRNGAWLRRYDLSVAPRFLWECLTNRTVSWFPSPAASNEACRFPALRSRSLRKKIYRT